jgi:phage head maturation protease
MARIRTVLRAAADAETFSAPTHPVDQLIVAQKRAGWTLTISRETALQVTAVLRGRNLICSISTLPLTQYAPDGRRARSTLFEQLDPQVPNVVTMSQTVEDILFDGLSWWRVIERGWNRFPTKIQHIDVDRVHLHPPPGAQSLNLLPSGADPSAAVWIDTEVVPGEDMIRFDSPNPPLLKAARRAIRRAVLLERAAENYAESPKALGYFTPTEGADPADDEEISELLADWNDARNSNAEGYVPAALQYNVLQNPSPADLQLVQLQAKASLDIANAIGLDPEDLGISTTSRTYQNATDRRQDRINDVLAPYIRAVTDRLSMPDVTRRGYTVGLDLVDYLKADPITRATVYTQLRALRAITVDEIRADDGRPVLTSAQRAELAQLDTAPQEATMPQENSSLPNPKAIGFVSAAVGTHLVFPDNPGANQFAADAERRTIVGTVLPFGPIGSNRHGRWRFEPGSVSWNSAAVSRVKLNRDHNWDVLLGSATDIRASDDGVTARFKVARGAQGDEALSLAEDQALDGLSVEIDILDYAPDPDDPSVNVVTDARITGVALTATPGFDDARITSVAASSKKGTPMPTTKPPVPAPPVTAEFTADQLQEIARTAVTAVLDGVQAEFTADQLQEIARTAVTAVLDGVQDGPAPVNPRRTASLKVQRNELPYAFNGRKSEHEFSTDVFSLARRSDGEAAQRIEEFFREVFDVTTGDVDELNPTRNRPDLYVDNLDFTTPIWSTINKGAVANSVPFTIPKFGTSAGLTGPHTEGVEPAGGTFTTTGQTITPTPVSGKVELTRETIDQGGNPQTSRIIWQEIVRSYNEALETGAVDLLDGLGPGAIALTGTDADLDQDVVSNFAALQFVRGGNRFRSFFLASPLYTALAEAVDDRGRRLYPILAPSNAGGLAAPDYAYLLVGSLPARPAWALEAGNGGSDLSYLFNSDDVSGWATAPRKLEFEYEVKSVWLGVWGYQAFANTRLTGVRQVTYSVV